MYTEIILRLDGIKPKLASEICDHLLKEYSSIDTIDTIYHTKPDGDDDQTEDEDDQTESENQTENESQTETEAKQTENKLYIVYDWHDYDHVSLGCASTVDGICKLKKQLVADGNYEAQGLSLAEVPLVDGIAHFDEAVDIDDPTESEDYHWYID